MEGRRENGNGGEARAEDKQQEKSDGIGNGKGGERRVGDGGAWVNIVTRVVQTERMDDEWQDL